MANLIRQTFLIAVTVIVSMIWPSSALVAGYDGQYHLARPAVSEAPFTPVSRRVNGPGLAVVISTYSHHKARLGTASNRPQSTRIPQYHDPDESDSRRARVLGIGLSLGLVYVAFLVVWLWATRWRTD